MTTFGDQLFQFGGAPVGLPAGGLELCGGKVFFCDPTHGSTSGDATTPATANTNLKTVYGLTRDGYNDIVFLLGGATAYNPAAAFTWSNSYCHLIGISPNLPGLGQRARVVALAATALTNCITFSGASCYVKNIQFYNGANTAIDAGAATVSATRCLFENCFFAGMGDATASGPATRANAFSLTVSGDENVFLNCTIGLDTIIRSGLNSELIMSGVRNHFTNCLFQSSSVTSGKFMVNIVTNQDTRLTRFDRCMFYNFTTNWATGIANAFTITGAGDTYNVFLHDCVLGPGITGWGDVITHIITADPAPSAGAGISVAVTT